MKKRIILFALVLLLLFSALSGAFAAESADVFSVEATEGIPYNGYLVYVREDTQPRLSLLSANVESVTDNLYRVDSLEEIRSLWPARGIVYIEPNYEITLFSSSEEPNDPLFHLQWDMRQINAQSIWDSGITADGVRIAVIDSGIVQGHEDINYRYIARGFCYVTGTNNVRDTLGHGTQVTSAIVATRDNHVGIAGLLDQAQIIPLRVFETGRGDLAMAIRAIYDAVDVFYADVINMSWGITGGGQSESLERAVNHAVSRGVIMVAAAGNEGTSTYVYPAAYHNVIGVGAVDRSGNLAYFSQRNTSVFVVAPGLNIITLGHMHSADYNRNPGSRGTSIATPYVAAMAAIAKSVRHDITAAEFKDLLARSAVAGPNRFYGHGRIDMQRFIDILPETNWIAGFRDITGHWASESITYCVGRGLFFGLTNYRFGPEQNMSRAMLVTVLGRLYEQTGGQIPVRNDDFIDTQANSWYSRYVAWAAEHEIVQGEGGGRFNPYGNVSRQQTAAIFYRFAQHVGLDTSADPAVLNRFIDRQSVDVWAVNAMAWAVERGIITGIPVGDDTTLQATGSSSRAQVAVIIERFTRLPSQSQMAA